MIPRLLIASAILTTTLTGVAMNAARQERPSLLYFRSAACPPCQQFDDDTTDRRGRDTPFMIALRREFRIVPSYLDVKHPDEFRRWNVTRTPTWLVIDSHGRELVRVSGYGGPHELWKQLTCRDGVCVPLPRVNSQPAPSTTDPAPRPPVRSVADGELLRRISESNRRLEHERDSLQAAVRQLHDQIAALKRHRVEQQPPPPPAPPKISAETSDEPTQPEIETDALSSSWKSVGLWCARTAVTLGAPHIALPGAAVLTAVGIGVSWLRRRRHTRRSQDIVGSRSEPSTVRVDTERRQTENHYVVKETDRFGEAYKEACRRVAAARKSDAPGIVDVIKQIEHVAGEIIRGGRIVERPQTAPRPGIWQDPDESHVNR